MDGDELAHAAGGGSPGVGGGLDGADVAANHDGDVGGADLNLADVLDAGGLDHGVGGLDGTDQPQGFNHAQRFFGHGWVPDALL